MLASISRRTLRSLRFWDSYIGELGRPSDKVVLNPGPVEADPSEDQGKRSEEKLDFTPEGFALFSLPSGVRSRVRRKCPSWCRSATTMRESPGIPGGAWATCRGRTNPVLADGAPFQMMGSTTQGFGWPERERRDGSARSCAEKTRASTSSRTKCWLTMLSISV